MKTKRISISSLFLFLALLSLPIGWGVMDSPAARAAEEGAEAAAPVEGTGGEAEVEEPTAPAEGELPPPGEPPAPPEITTPPAGDTKIIAPTGEEMPQGMPRRTNNKISMSFEKADIDIVLRALSEAWETTIVADSSLEGTVTVVSMMDIPIEESFEVLKAILFVKGFTVVGTLDDKVIKILPAARGKTSPQPVLPEGQELKAGDTVVTYVLPLEFIDAARIKNDLTPLVSQDTAALVSIASTNHLIITDVESNVKRIVEIVKQLDKEPPDERTLEIIYLKNADAQEVQQALTNLFQDPMAAIMQQMRRMGGGGGMGGGMGGGPPQPQQPMFQQGRLDLESQVQVQADTRTNSLLVFASPENHKKVAEVVEKLDVDLTPLIIHRRFPLQYADATTVADELNELFEQPQGGTSRAGGRSPFGFSPFSFLGRQRTTSRTGFTSLKENIVVADVRTNSVIVTATEENMKRFEDIIKALDEPAELQEMTIVYPLKYAVATELVDTLNQLFRGQGRTTGFLFFMFGSRSQQQGGPLDIFQDVTVVAEEKTNSLLITSPPQARQAVTEIIEQLDKPLAQVYIHVVIADVTLTDETKLGVEWKWLNALDEGSSLGTDFQLADPNEPVGFKYAILNNDFRSVLHALATQMDTKVLSTPHITTLNNVEARISIGQDYPFVESITTSGTTGYVIPQFDFKRIAIDLTVTPRIHEESKTIMLEVVQTINDIAGTVQQGQFTQPIVTSREAQASVMVRDGQTIVLGGIMSDRTEFDEKRIPVLSEIPLFGELFKSRRKKNVKSELMVFMTPFIVEEGEDVDQLRGKYEKDLKSLFPEGSLTPDVLTPQPEKGEADISAAPAAPAEVDPNEGGGVAEATSAGPAPPGEEMASSDVEKEPSAENEPPRAPAVVRLRR